MPISHGLEKGIPLSQFTTATAVPNHLGCNLCKKQGLVPFCKFSGTVSGGVDVEYVEYVYKRRVVTNNGEPWHSLGYYLRCKLDILHSVGNVLLLNET